MIRVLKSSAAFFPVHLTSEDIAKCAEIREAAFKFAQTLTFLLPSGRELDILIEQIENTSMRAVKTFSEQARERNGA